MALKTQCDAQAGPAATWLSSSARKLVSFPSAIAAILIGKAFWTCRGNIVDTDLGWHLRNGQYLLTHWRFPTHDSYSFTAAGSVWIDHSWLSELLYYASYHVLGLRGIFLLFLLTIAALVLIIFLVTLQRAEDPLSAAVVTIFGGLLAMVGYTPRPQNFGWLCFAGIFVILLRFREHRQAPLWVLPVLFCVWINCHPGWPFGFAVFALILGCGFLQRDIGQITAAPWTGSDKNKLSLALAASVAALFVNPFGYRLVLYPLDMAIRQKMNVSMGVEWRSVDFNDERGIYVIITIAAVFVLFLLPRKRWRVDDVVLIAFALFCGLKHIRFLMVTGVVVPPIIVTQLGRLSSYNPARERRVLNAAILAFVVAMMIVKFPTNQQLETEMNQFFPADAIRYLSEQPQEGNMFNAYEWGGYLEWKLPGLKTFIDSRTDIFEYKGVFKDYVTIGNLDGSEELLDKYRIGYIFYPASSPLTYFLSKSADWECVFRDGHAAIYRRARQREN